VLSGQIHPEKMLKHVSEFVNENGVLIITVSSTCGLLSEICRRLMVIKIDEISRERERGARYNLNRRLSLACKIFSPHLKALNANSRSVKDWCLDCIFNPWLGDYNFTISKAINAIGKDFNIYHTASPSFFLDDSWYKKSQKKDINKLAVNQFYQKLLGFLDYRVNFDSIGERETDKNFRELEFLCNCIFKLHNNFLKKKNYSKLSDLIKMLQEIKKILPYEMSLTKLAINDYVISLPKFIDNYKIVKFNYFKKWWGRGQNYLSFVRK